MHNIDKPCKRTCFLMEVRKEAILKNIGQRICYCSLQISLNLGFGSWTFTENWSNMSMQLRLLSWMRADLLSRSASCNLHLSIKCKVLINRNARQRRRLHDEIVFPLLRCEPLLSCKKSIHINFQGKSIESLQSSRVTCFKI